MSFAYSPKIVTDGLIFYVDAANPKSYVSGDTTTNDLISNITGTLENGVGYSIDNNGSWSFDGTDDFINCGSVFTDTNSKTFMCWANFDSFAGGYSKHTMAKWDASLGKRTLELVCNNNFLYFLISSNGSSFTSHSNSQPLSIGVWYFLVGVYDLSNNKIKSSINGQAFQETNYSNGMNSSDSELLIGGVDNTGRMDGKISLSMVYNRALSATEVLQNYNATKTRFGL